MKVLVTGANGFIGKNLILRLNELENYEVISIGRDNTKEELEQSLLEAEFIFHLAGINRPEDEKEFFVGNSDFTGDIVKILKDNTKNTPIVMTSSIQADLDNAYGKSKKLAEEELLRYKYSSNAKVFIYRLPNVFGKWCRPNYNSAIATFCNNIAKGEEVWISDPKIELNLVYIDDVVRCLISSMENRNSLDGYVKVDVEYKVTLGRVVELLNSFVESRRNLMIPNMEDEFTKKLYSTYLSYLPEDRFSYPLKMNIDNRGSFTEFLKATDRGQVSINISKPGITKGNHYHHTKNEKFLVVSGEGIIKLRRINSEEVIEYKVRGEKLEVIDIPVGYTHNITNTGKGDMVTVMWVNETFDIHNPDTIFMEV